MQKVVHLTSVHPTFDIRIFHKMCRSVAQAGFETTLIVPGETSEPKDGVRIRTVPRPRNRRERILRTLKQIYDAALKENSNLYHFHDPELLSVGLALKRRGKKVIYDAHEDVPRDVLQKEYIPSILRPLTARMTAAVESFGSQRLDHVFAATESVARHLPSSKTTVVANYPILSEFDQLPPRSFEDYLSRPNISVYVGALSRDRGTLEMVKGIGILPASLNAKLKLSGMFDPPELEQEIRSLIKAESIEIMGHRSQSAVKDDLRTSRIGLSLLHPISSFVENIPTKVFEYMAAGIPLVISDSPIWRGFVETHGCGLTADALNPQDISEKVAWLLQHPREAYSMGQRGRQAVLSRYSWENEAKKMIAVYHSILDTK